MRRGALLIVLILILASSISAQGEDLSASDLLEDANRSYQKGSFDLALQHLNRSLELDPDQAEAWVLRGEIALYNLSDRDLAAESFARALAIDPQNAKVWYEMGNSLSFLGRAEEALDCYNRTLAIDPNNEKAWNNKGLILGVFGQLRGCCALFWSSH
jgi:Putative Zn-dependent protease, contains TPR repeats